MLYEWIVTVMARVAMALAPLRGKWAPLWGVWALFFHFLGLMFVPGLVVAAPIAFSLEGLMASRVSDRRARVSIALAGAALYAVLSGVMGYVAQLGWKFGPRPEEAFAAPIFVILPISAAGVFGFWLPAISSGLYTVLAKRPRWWATFLIGVGTLILGILLWIVLGTLVGAQTD